MIVRVSVFSQRCKPQGLPKQNQILKETQSNGSHLISVVRESSMVWSAERSAVCGSFDHERTSDGHDYLPHNDEEDVHHRSPAPLAMACKPEKHQHDGWESLRPSPIDPGLGVEGAKATASMVCLGAAFRVATSICVGWNRLWGDNGGARKGLCGLAEERVSTSRCCQCETFLSRPLCFLQTNVISSKRYHHKHP